MSIYLARCIDNSRYIGFAEVEHDSQEKQEKKGIPDIDPGQGGLDGTRPWFVCLARCRRPRVRHRSDPGRRRDGVVARPRQVLPLSVAETSTPELCSPIREEPLATEDAERLSEWFGVLSDPTRLRLLSLIASAGEACAACDLVEPLGVSQPTVSHHLKVLRDAGFVESRKDGRWVYYSLVPGRLDDLRGALVEKVTSSTVH